MRYDKGVTSLLEVQDTERELFAVALEHSDVNQLYHNTYVKLYKALGGGWLSKEEMEQTQNQPQVQKTKHIFSYFSWNLELIISKKIDITPDNLKIQRSSKIHISDNNVEIQSSAIN